MRRFHRHAWKVVEKTEQRSLAEQMESAGYEISAKRAGDDHLERLFRKTTLVHYRCATCPSEKVVRV